MITLTDNMFLSNVFPLDARGSNIVLDGSTVKVETQIEYLERVDQNSRYLGMEVEMLSPVGSYSITNFINQLELGNIVTQKFKFLHNITDAGLVEINTSIEFVDDQYIPIKSVDHFESSPLHYNSVADEIISESPIRTNIIAPTGSYAFEDSSILSTNSDSIEISSKLDNRIHEVITEIYDDNGSQRPYQSVKSPIQTFDIQLLEDNQSTTFELRYITILYNVHWTDFVIKPKAAGIGKFVIRDTDSTGIILNTSTEFEIGVDDINTEFVVPLENRIKISVGGAIYVTYTGPSLAGHNFIGNPVPTQYFSAIPLSTSNFLPYSKVRVHTYEDKELAYTSDTITEQERLDLEAAYAHSILTSGNPHAVTKSNVGLGNVDNTSDVNKPISSATQTALNGKVNNSQVLTNVPAGAVFTDTTYTDAEIKTKYENNLNTNAYTDDEKTKLEFIDDYANENVFTHLTQVAPATFKLNLLNTTLYHGRKISVAAPSDIIPTLDNFQFSIDDGVTYKDVYDPYGYPINLGTYQITESGFLEAFFDGGYDAWVLYSTTADIYTLRGEGWSGQTTHENHLLNMHQQEYINELVKAASSPGILVSRQISRDADIIASFGDGEVKITFTTEEKASNDTSVIDSDINNDTTLIDPNPLGYLIGGFFELTNLTPDNNPGVLMFRLYYDGLEIANVQTRLLPNATKKIDLFSKFVPVILGDSLKITYEVFFGAVRIERVDLITNSTFINPTTQSSISNQVLLYNVLTESISGLPTLQNETNEEFVSNINDIVNNVLPLKADLIGGKVPTSQLPNFVSELIEGYIDIGDTQGNGYEAFYEDAGFTTIIVPDGSAVYVDVPTADVYRWSGSVYIKISDTLSAVEIKTLYESNTDTNAYTDAEKSKLAGIAPNANNYVHPATHSPSIIVQDPNNRLVTDVQISDWTGAVSDINIHIATITGNPHMVTKSNVGLGNADNTSDLNKPISTATQSALNGKANLSHTHSDSDITLTGTHEWYTTDEQTKLSGIEAGAEVNTVDSVNGQTGIVSLDSDDISEGSTNLYMTSTQETNFETAYSHSQIVTGNPHNLDASDVGAEPANANIQSHIADVTKHRLINDSGNTTIDLWSADKIQSKLNALGANDLTDVDTTTTPPNVGDRLSWNGSNWVPVDPSVGGGSTIYLAVQCYKKTSILSTTTSQTILYSDNEHDPDGAYNPATGKVTIQSSWINNYDYLEIKVSGRVTWANTDGKMGEINLWFNDGVDNLFISSGTGKLKGGESVTQLLQLHSAKLPMSMFTAGDYFYVRFENMISNINLIGGFDNYIQVELFKL